MYASDECDFGEGTFDWLIHQLKRLAEKVAEVQEAVALSLLKDYWDPRKIQAGWRDARAIMHGIEKHHPWIKEADMHERGA